SGGGGYKVIGCGCAVPFPHGIACRYANSKAPVGGEMAQWRCPCGEYCDCNPCTCPGTERVIAAVARTAGVKHESLDETKYENDDVLA
ncbi:unnamed protein product, partial [Citrullus colocynthis]